MLRGAIVGALLTLVVLAAAGWAAYLTLGPRAMPAPSGDSVLEGIAAELAAASAYINEQTEPGSVDRGEGQRYALRVIERNLSLLMGDHNAATPTISRCPSQLCKYGFDNPDTTYVAIGPLSRDHEYRISGLRGSVAHVTYQIFEFGPGGFVTGDSMESTALEVAEDGSYSIYLGAANSEEHSNFLALPPSGAARLIIRQLHNDWSVEQEQSFAVEVLSNPDQPQSGTLMDEAIFARRGLGLSQMLRNNLTSFRELIANDLPVNEFGVPANASLGSGGGFPTNVTSAARYELPDDAVLLIESPHIDVIYQNIQLGNLWGESLDYGTRTVSYNGHQAYRDEDGWYRYVVSQVDPGVPNWLDAEGHPSGGIFMRWQSPVGPVPAPLTRIVQRGELRQHLPATHPTTTPAQRAAVLRDRLSGYNRRKNPV